MESIPTFAARMAAGSGMAQPEFQGDAGELHHRDISFAEDPLAESGRRPSRLRATVAAAGSGSRSPPAAKTRHPNVQKTAELHAAIAESLGTLELLNEEFDTRLVMGTRRCEETCEQLAGRLVLFDAGHVNPGPIGFDIPRLLRESPITLDLGFQRDFGSRVAVPGPEKYESVLSVLSTTLLEPLSAVEAAAVSSGSVAVANTPEAMLERIRQNLTCPLFPLGDRELPQLLVDANRFAPSDPVETTQTEIDDLVAEAEVVTVDMRRLELELAAARRAEDITRAAELERLLYDASARRFELLLQALGLVGRGRQDEDNKRAGLAAILAALDSADTTRLLRAEKEELLETARRDVRTLDVDRARRQKIDERALAAYDSAVRRNSDQLAANAMRQKKQWAAMAEALRTLVELQAEAKGLAAGRTALTEEEQRRRQELREFKAAYGEHRQYLSDVELSSEVSLEFLGRCDEYLAECRERVAQKDIASRIDELLRRRRHDLAAAFGDFALRGSRRAHVLDVKGSNATRVETEMAFAAGGAAHLCDDSAPEYTAQQKRQRKQRAAAESEAFTVRGEGESAQTRYLVAVGLTEPEEAEESVPRLSEAERDAADAEIAHEHVDDPRAAPLLVALKLRAELRLQFAGRLSVHVSGEEAAASELRKEGEVITADAEAIRARAQERKNRKLSASPSRGGDDGSVRREELVVNE